MVHMHPGGFFVDMVQPTVLVVEDEHETEAQRLVTQAVFLLIFAVSVLFVAPFTEEIVFRRIFHWARVGTDWILRRTATAGGLGDATAGQSSRHAMWVVAASLLFAAAHLLNHVPVSGDVGKFLQEHGTENTITQLTLALAQFSITFFLSIRVFTPVHESMGLIAAMGSHFMWNACALAISHHVWIRLLFASTTFFGRRRLERTARTPNRQDLRANRDHFLSAEMQVLPHAADPSSAVSSTAGSRASSSSAETHRPQQHGSAYRRPAPFDSKAKID